MIVAPPDKLEVDLSDVDVEWHIMGMCRDKMFSQSILVHEYASLSAPPFSKIKNRIKRRYSCKPDLRVFLNEHVRSGLGFCDTVPAIYRDMAVHNNFFCQSDFTDRKEYDFVYVGAMDRSRRLDQLLDFVESLQATIVMVGAPSRNLVERYGRCDNIHFCGKVDYLEVPAWICKAKAAVNWIPDVYPYNVQTSTKFLEYLAAGIPIVTTRYKWVEEFVFGNPGLPVFYLDDVPNLIASQFTWDRATAEKALHVPRWKELLDSSGIRTTLLGLLSKI